MCFLLLPQAMAAVLDPSVFLYSIIYKFRLDTWITWYLMHTVT